MVQIDFAAVIFIEYIKYIHVITEKSHIVYMNETYILPNL